MKVRESGAPTVSVRLWCLSVRLWRLSSELVPPVKLSEPIYSSTHTAPVQAVGPRAGGGAGQSGTH